MGYVELVAAVNAILTAISVWQSERSFKRASETYEETFERTREDPETEKVAARIRSVLPPGVAEVFRGNIAGCWGEFKQCISGSTREDELNKCESSLQTCICANLRSLVKTNGSLPTDLLDLWTQFACGPTPPTS